MFIGEPNIYCLKAFLDGWLSTLDEPSGDSNRFILKFYEFVVNKYNIKTSHSWARIIAFYSSDQYSAMVEALDLLAEFGSKYRDPGTSS
jgi:hypothetical protein